MHDGNHMAYHKSTWANWLAGNTLELVGSSSIIYKRSHDFGHHGCVNHLELDRAFDTTYPLIRLHPKLPYKSYLKHQWWYSPILLGLTNFGDMFGMFDEIYWMSNYPARRAYISKRAVFARVVVLIYWFIHTIIIPAYIHGYDHLWPVWFFYMYVFSMGYAWFFAVNHWTTEAGLVDFTNISKTNWGKLQVENSTNFACDSWLWTHLSGGLNYQIEHHLFPGYVHTRLPEIRDIVMDTCKEFDIQYN